MLSNVKQKNESNLSIETLQNPYKTLRHLKVLAIFYQIKSPVLTPGP